MIISSPADYRDAAKHRLPRFLFDYIDCGAVTEKTMHENRKYDLFIFGQPPAAGALWRRSPRTEHHHP